jgi:2-polyprenyl-3-methyl-5-hydroxy-6-metoxy-1,4-benzoquinol methylase
MNIERIRQRRQEIIESDGPWTAHNIQFTDDLYTMEPRVVGDEIKLQRIVQIVSDVARKPLSELRVLDLGSLEGLYAIELARHGARAVAIEGREANARKILFAKEALELENLEVCRDDVRHLDARKHGYFDVVLCLGLLYHLDAPDVFHFVENLAEVCHGALVLDTHISLASETSHGHRGEVYWGSNFMEFEEGATEEQRESMRWAALDNPKSFWLTRPSLGNLLSRVGFTSTYECYNPPDIAKPRDRITLLAIKGQRETLLSAPLLNDRAPDSWPEAQAEAPLLKKLRRRLIGKLAG